MIHWRLVDNFKKQEGDAYSKLAEIKRNCELTMQVRKHQKDTANPAWHHASACLNCCNLTEAFAPEIM